MTDTVWDTVRQYCSHCGTRLTFPALERAPVTCPHCRTRYRVALAYSLARPDAPPSWMLFEETRHDA
jgi:uncharacterized paraquat-inducible protein A